MTNGTPAEKKGLSTIAWIAIGCGGLIVLGLVGVFGLGFFAVKKGKEMVTEATGADSFQDFVDDMQQNPAKTTAEAMIRINPDLEIVSTDDEAGTITFVNQKTGEEATLNFEDIAEGRFSMKTEEGEYRLDAADGGEGGVTFTGPEGQETRWGASADLDAVPDWVPAYPGATETQSVFNSSGPSGVSGILTAKTTDSAQKVFDNYKTHFERAGWTIDSQSMTTTGDGAFGSLVGKLDGRTVNVGVAQQGGECQVTINYNGKA